MVNLSFLRLNSQIFHQLSASSFSSIQCFRIPSKHFSSVQVLHARNKWTTYNALQNKAPQSREFISNKSSSFRLLTALISGGILFYSFHKNFSYAHCFQKSTLAIDNNVKAADKKWKDCKIKLYQYQTCPFCSKARSFLIANNIPFEIIEVHPIYKKEIKFSKYKKVPIVVFEQGGTEVQLNDSSVIISALSSYMLDDGGRSLRDILDEYSPTKICDNEGKEKEIVKNRHDLIINNQTLNAEQQQSLLTEKEWRIWTDEFLVHLISPNVYRTLRESYDSFDYHVSLGKFHGTWEGTVAKYGGALAMWIISKRLKKRHCVNEDVRLDLYEACNKWSEAIGDDMFLGGSSPNLADIVIILVFLLLFLITAT